MNWYILAVSPVFGLLVFVHELGHFLTAKWAGIRVEEFGLGFPPNIVSIRKRDRGGWDVMWLGQGRDVDTSAIQNPFSNTNGDADAASVKRPSHTIYSLNLLPIGGFVRMPGESGDAYDENGVYDPDSFAAKTAGKRIIVLCAGVVMNFLLAIALFTVAYTAGEPNYAPGPVVGTVEANSPAQAAGLRVNDTIVTVNNAPVKTFDQMSTDVTQAIKSSGKHQGNAPVHLQVLHQGSKTPVAITVNARVNPAPDQGAMGIGRLITLTKYPVWQAPVRGFVQTFTFLHEYLSIIGKMIIGAQPVQLSGPVGIAQATGTVAEMTTYAGWWPMLSFTAALSLNLAIFNIIPFPALDGGRVFLIFIEILRGGKRLKPEREGLINFVGFACLLLLMVVVTVSDIMHWGS
jgi:regulator of sigma E protease